MNKYKVYSKDGSIVRCETASLEYHGEWMGACSVTLSVSSATPIDFEIGDYVEYRGERFTINYDPTELKQASNDSYGEAFKYENIVFNSYSDELTRCMFLDYVKSDNMIHYSSLPVFSFYAEDITYLAERIQVNLDRIYSGDDKWVVEVHPEYVNVTNRNISVSSVHVWDALALVKSEFDANFIIRGRKIIIGTEGIAVDKLFSYGKGNGLYSIQKTAESDQAIVTRLRAYGSTKNLRIGYYKDVTTRCIFPPHELSGISDSRLTIDTTTDITKCFTTHWEGEEDNVYRVKIQIGSATAIAKAYVFDNPKVTIDVNTDTNNTIEAVQAIVSAYRSGYDYIELTSGVNKSVYPVEYVISSPIPNNMAISNLMLPSFPKETLDPYIDSANISELGIREGTIFFDGSGDLEEIYPTLEEMTAEELKAAGVSVTSSGALDVVVDAEEIEDDGTPNAENEAQQSTFTITIKDIGFDISDYITGEGNPSISMKDGMCGGREFQITKCEKSGSNYVLTCERVFDESIGLFFPYKHYNIESNDSFVLLNIEMPEVYVLAASQRLLAAATEWLSKNDYTRYTYEPKVDEIFMAKQHEEALKSGDVSIHDTIKEGDLMVFEDDDLGINGSIIISSLNIKESGESVPTYEIVLQEDKAVGTIQKIQNQIDSIITKGVKGGGYNAQQIQSFVRTFGEKYFLRKDKPDSTSYLQKFLGGIEVGEAFDSMSDAGKGTIIDRTGRIQGDRIELRSSLTIGKNGYAEGFTGFGGRIDEDANAELESLTLRRELRVPNLVFNNIEIYVGDKWRASGGGVIERVVPDTDDNGNNLDTGTFYLKLEEGQIGAVFVNAISMGIFHDWKNKSNNATADEEVYGEVDGEQKLTKKTYSGFATSYFLITEVSDYSDENGVVWSKKQCRYKLRNGYTIHPYEEMNFVCYGIFSTNEEELIKYGTSVYETRTYTRMLFNQNTWEIGANNIGMQWGDLSNLAIHGMNMQGYSAYMNNIYMTGVIKQFNSAGNEIKVANDRGEYVSGTHYDYYDRVSYNGGLWLCIAENGTNTPPSKNDSAWLNQVPAAQGITSQPNWDSSKVPYPASTILKFAERIWISNKETSAAPLPLYTDPNGNYYKTPEGGYYIASETQSADWDLLLDASGLTDGEDGASIEVRYSADGTNWHFPYKDGDIYMQQRIGSDSAWSDIITFVGEDGAAGADGKYTDYQFAVNDSLTIAPATGWQETPPAVGEGQYLWMRMRVVNPNDGTSTSWSVARIGGEEGTSVFKSTVFIRTNDTPSTPEGGSYASPVPTTTGWSEGIPEGEQILWASTRVFTHNGKKPQEDVWSTPRQMTDTADFDVEFSSVENPNPPTGHPNTNTQWSNESGTDTIWMATSQKKNGVWGEWKVSKIKGEKGDMGVSITTHGQWKSGMTVPVMGVVTMGGNAYIAKKETSNPPLWCYTDPNGNYYITHDGGYYLTGEANTAEYDILVQSGKDGADGKDYEWIYQVKATEDTPSKPASVQQDDYVPSGWNDDPTGVSETLPYEFASFRTKKDGNWSEYSTPALWAKFGKDGIDGLQGLQGEKGEQGIQGEKGDNGQTSYFHIKYADDANGTNMNESGGDYIGTYVDFTQQDSTDPTKYTWVKTKGAQGEKGDQGIPGTNGENGQTSYLHIAYANSADGKDGFSVSDSKNKLYIGQYTDFILEDSTDYTKYKWTLIKGADGKDGVNAIYADMDNEMDSVALTSDGKSTAATELSTTVSMWNGSTKASLKSISVSAVSGVTTSYTLSSGVVKFNIAKGTTIAAHNEFKITVVSTINGVDESRTLTFTLNGVKAGADGKAAVLYKLLLSVNSVTKKSDGTYSVDGVNAVRCKIEDGVTSITTEGKLKYLIDDKDASTYETEIGNAVDIPSYAFADRVRFTFYNDEGYIVDRETVPMIADGAGFEMMGNWKSGLSVPLRGVVQMGGGTYVAKKATTRPPLFCYTDPDGNYYLTPEGGYYLTGELNTTDYETWAEKGEKGEDGKDGAQGEKGDKGDTGAQGKQGIQGCVYRISEWVAGVKYHNDIDLKTEGIRYIDIVTTSDGGKYVCKATHVSTTSGAPSAFSEEWEEMNDMQPIYTSLLFAENAIFRFGQGNQFLITDEGNIVTAGVSGSNNGKKIRFWAGSQEPDDAPFQIDVNGAGQLAGGKLSWDKDNKMTFTNNTEEYGDGNVYGRFTDISEEGFEVYETAPTSSPITQARTSITHKEVKVSSPTVGYSTISYSGFGVSYPTGALSVSIGFGGMSIYDGFGNVKTTVASDVVDAPKFACSGENGVTETITIGGKTITIKGGIITKIE